MATLLKLYCTSVCLGLWLAMLLVLQPCECRYLPTRSRGDELDRLRELMLQILESSNEDSQHPPNEANGNTLLQRPSWLNKMSPVEAGEAQRKYGASYGSQGGYEGVRYY